MGTANVKNEISIFETIQGEGLHAGTPSFFVRLQGCSVHCFFCDEKDTWLNQTQMLSNSKSQLVTDGSQGPSQMISINEDVKDLTVTGNIKIHDKNIKEGIDTSPESIIEVMRGINPNLKRVVITGGEPTEQDLSGFIEMLINRGFAVAVETAATGIYLRDLLELQKLITCHSREGGSLWITFSPKEIYSVHGKVFDERIWQYCSELKFVIANEQAESYLFDTIIPKLYTADNHCPVFLVPNWFDIEENKNRVLDLCRRLPERVRVGMQMHKFIGVH